MFLDIIVIAILVLTMVSGFRKGFIYTFVHSLGWIGSVILAFVFSPRLRTFVESSTQFDDRIHAIISDKLALSSDSLNASTDSLPLILGRSINTAAEDAAQIVADKLTDLTMTVFCFLLILAAAKVVLFLLTLALSKRKNKTFTGFLDGILGLVAGLIRGVILVFLFLALLLPVISLISPASTQLVLDSLAASHFSRTLYDSNFIILLINDFLA